MFAAPSDQPAPPTHPGFELRERDFDTGGFLTSLNHDELNLFLDQLTKQERQQFGVIGCFVYVFAEALQKQAERQTSADYMRGSSWLSTYPLQRLFDGNLLRIDKAPDGDLDGEIDIVASDILAQVHLGARFGHSDHRFQVSHGDGERSGGERFASQVRVESGQLFLVELVQLGLDHLFGIHDVFPEHILRDDLWWG